ncbi:transglutaminase family protein [Catenovulum agarivorans]|uniref:transglutaminase family protein n=1 Tax=Catenovulum agarivorans TaxID=1172192 RepID=UPI0002EB2601|nr:transglutaminase family protein [Catenovulum agarivorans]
MKRYKVRHYTQYTYPEPVLLFPHLLRVRPREGVDLRIISSELTVFPKANLFWFRDVESNSVASASFFCKTNVLSVNSEVLVEKYDAQPFDFLVEDYAVDFPFIYQTDELVCLRPYMSGYKLAKSDLVQAFVDEFWVYGDHIQTFTLLFEINQYIHQNFVYIKRDEEGVQSPEQTLYFRSGSCRDFAYLYMTVVKQLGFASRFVSGYICSDYLNGAAGATHAWVEVFIPGVGWKGFDPTQGTLTGFEHIPVAVARCPRLVPPVSGQFYGAGISAMAVSVFVSEVLPTVRLD